MTPPDIRVLTRCRGASIMGGGSPPIHDTRAERAANAEGAGAGVWLSLVERTVRVREVGSSNLPTPTQDRLGSLFKEG